jgi:hypothetical protein
LDDQCRTETSEKLVMHCRGPKETAVRYNKYVVNGKLFRTVDGLTYYEKLTDIIEV